MLISAASAISAVAIVVMSVILTAGQSAAPGPAPVAARWAITAGIFASGREHAAVNAASGQRVSLSGCAGGNVVRHCSDTFDLPHQRTPSPDAARVQRTQLSCPGICSQPIRKTRLVSGSVRAQRPAAKYLGGRA
jgi:hypothetical protein